jgi:S1-C subfamily serine protease
MGFENVESGLLVLRVQAGADNDVGLQPGDVIIAAQGEPVSTLAGLLQAEERAQESGQALRLTIQRGDSRELLLVQ